MSAPLPPPAAPPEVALRVGEQDASPTHAPTPRREVTIVARSLLKVFGSGLPKIASCPQSRARTSCSIVPALPEQPMRMGCGTCAVQAVEFILCPLRDPSGGHGRSGQQGEGRQTLCGQHCKMLISSRSTAVLTA